MDNKGVISATRKIQILALPQVFDSAFHIVRDTLTAATQLGMTSVSVETVTINGGPITTGSGQVLEPDRSAARTLADIIIVPGFYAGDSAAAAIQYVECSSSRPIVDWLARRHAAGAELAGGCTGVWLLGEAGVLDGRSATTTWYYAEPFRARYPKVKLDPSRMTTYSGRVRCAGAAMAHMDLALAVITQAFGGDIARRVASLLLLDARPSQAHFMITDFLCNESEILRNVDTWIRGNLSRPIEVADLARATHLSTRTLSRRIRQKADLSPLQYVQRVRLEEASRLLKTTSLSVALIAERVGYRDQVTLRRLMKQRMGRRPSDLRGYFKK